MDKSILKHSSKSKYNFETLCDVNPDLAPYVFINIHDTKTIDFGNPKAVKALNTSLLFAQGKVKFWEFPDANLTTIDGIRADFANGWGLVRCSNTTPCLVMRFDADNEEALEKIKEEFRVQILSVDSTLDLPF